MLATAGVIYILYQREFRSEVLEVLSTTVDALGSTRRAPSAAR